MTTQNFRELKVWAKAHELVLDIYGSSRNFPREERYGLTSQMRRSAVSIPSNMAGGCWRTQGDFRRFVQIATGSASELEYQLLLAKDLEHLSEDVFQGLSKKTTEIKRMLTAFLARLKADG